MTRIKQMMDFCDNENIYSFADLVDYCANHRGDWFITLTTARGTHIMYSYLISRAHKAGLLTDEQYAARMAENNEDYEDWLGANQ